MMSRRQSLLALSTILACGGLSPGHPLPELQKMCVGANYPWPWNAYGSYFGSPAMRHWPNTLGDNLARLCDAGVGIVRLFLLGNGWSYGEVTQGVFSPPSTLPATFTEQFELLLVAFQARGMMCIPSILDFPALQGPAGTKGRGGRAAIVTDASVRDHFFAALLEPLLSVADRYRPEIFAIEVMNEPTWVTLDPLSSMRAHVTAFLTGAIARIAMHGHQSTVGHRFSSDLDDLPTGSLRQCHYYPREGLRALLPLTERRLRDYAQTRAFLGEFSSRNDGSEGDDWPEIGDALQRDPRRRVYERLRCAQAKGYGLSLVWPDLDGVPFGAADPLKFSSPVLAGIRDFTSGAGPGAS
jgi:hypothetical protein